MDIDALLEKIDILDYVSQYCEFEEKNGEWWALSPLKDENTPSFSINREKQRFYDFSSGTGGNVINFIREYNRCGFNEALQILMRYANIENVAETEPLKRLGCVSVAKRFRESAPKTKVASTSVLPEDHMSQYEFNKDKLKTWADEGISYEVMEKYGVRYDDFSNRIVYPIRDYQGQIINVCGRTLDEDYKIKGLRKYTYFNQFGGSLDTLYAYSDNADVIKKRMEIILFEGAKSVMLADGWGVNNCCAILTSHLNPQQFLFLAKLGLRVVFALDKEIDITKDRHIQKLSRYVSIEYIKDQNNLIEEKMSPTDRGYEVWQSLYKKRLRLN